MIYECNVCGVEFKAKQAAKRKYCSLTCHYKNMVGKKQSDETIIKRRESMLKVSKTDKWRNAMKPRWDNVGNEKRSPAWKGGRLIQNGYVYLYQPNHPSNINSNYVGEHRLVMEKHLGRFLDDAAVVHHIDEHRCNNNIDNLKLYGSNSEHIREHRLNGGGIK